MAQPLAMNVAIHPPVVFNGFEAEDFPWIISEITSYLSFRDKKSIRGVSKIWNRRIIESPQFCRQAVGSFSTSWYRQVAGINPDAGYPENTIKWIKFAFQHFNFYRNSRIFRSYWPIAASLLTKLEMDKCSFECDGFRFILDSCPHLTALKMKQAKLRDIDTHDEGFVAPAVPTTPGVLEELSFESMYQMGECFMDYLVSRTGNLKSISIVDCFKQTVPVGPDEPTIEDFFEDFLEDLVKLFRKNKDTLRNMKIISNGHQNLLLQRLATEGGTPETFPLPHELMITFSADSLAETREFYTIYCGNLRSLKLNVMERVENQTVIDALKLINRNLEKLRVSILGGVSTVVVLDLSTVLPLFTSLQKFNLQDRKVLEPIENRVISIRHRLFPYRMHRGLGTLAARLVDTLERANSRVEINCLAHLPPSITKLTIDGIVNYQLFFNDPLRRPGFSKFFSKLTKLEIKGPWLCPLGELMNVLITVAEGLETLILTKCCLTDMDVTGLCKEATADMRKAMTYALGMYTSMESPSPDVFDGLVNNAPTEWDRKRNMRRIGYGTGERRKLSGLTKLKHLDMSYNVNITDVTIYDALKLPNLQSLAIHSCNKVTDLGVEILTFNCPALEVLNVKNCRKLSSYGLNKVIKGCKRVRTIYTTRIIRNRDIEGFDFTPSINYQDIVKTCIMTEFEDPSLEEMEDD